MGKRLAVVGVGVFSFVGLLWANKDGALPRKSGGQFPSESVCTECHSSPQFGSIPNRGPGSITFTVQPYRPGETQRITVTVADPAQMRWGFQLTARPANALTTQAGSFRAVDADAQVICDDEAKPAPCPSGMLQFPTHTLAGTRRGTRNGVSFAIDWTAPSTDVGEIIFAAAGNAANGLDTDTGDNIYTTQVRVAAAAGAPTFTSVSSASFTAGVPLAAEMIASGFGAGLARDTAIAISVPLPTELLSTSVRVIDTQGTARLAPLFFVSAGQINYLIPAGTVTGTARVEVTSGAGGTISGAVQIDKVSPSIYSANAQGSGVAAASFLRVAADGTRTQGLLFDPGTRASVPVDLGPASDQVFLLLFGTGVRGFTSAVTATAGGQTVPVLGAVPQGQFVGLDQINIGPLPRALAGRGEVDLVITADGKAANTVKVNIR